MARARFPDLIQRVKSTGMNGVALTDHGNLYGVVEFLREAKYAGILPIVGMEAYVAPGKRTDRTTGGGGGASEERFAYHLTLLARNGTGFRNLLRLSSRAYLEGYYYKPRIDKEILAQHSEGLICLSGCVGSEFSQMLLSDRVADAENLARWYARTFGEENFYVEVQNNGLQIQHDCMERELDVARRLGLPVVATSDAHYLTQDDYLAHDVLLCINTGKTMDQPLDKPRFVADNGKLSDQFHVRSPRRCTRRSPAMMKPWRCRNESPAWSRRITVAWVWASVSSRRSSRPPERRPSNTSENCAKPDCVIATVILPRRPRSSGSIRSSPLSTGWVSPRTF